MEKIYSAHDIHTDPRGVRYMYMLFHRTLNTWGKTNTRLLRALPEKLITVNDPKVTHDRWLKVFISDYVTWGEMKTFGNIRSCPAVQIFTELSRTYFIIMYPVIMEENNKVSIRGEYDDSFIISYRMDMCDYLDGGNEWKRPLMMYTQQDIINALLMLTEKIDQLPVGAVGEVRKTLEILYLRNSVFLCQSNTLELLNVEGMRHADKLIPNRHYLTFCTIYFHAIQRRLFYYDQIAQERIEIDPRVVERIREWVTDLVDGLGPEGFEDCYSNACEEAYNFPGDREWFRYRYPDLPAQTGPILDCFRKEYAKRYFTEYRVSKESVLGAVDQTSHMGHTARIFVVNAVDQYMKTQFGIPWRDGLVIDNSAIEGAQVKLYRSKAPYLLQIFSRHWVYDRAVVYPCDNMYESLAIWMYILQRRYQSKVFGVSVDELISKIVDNAQKKSFTAPF